MTVDGVPKGFNHSPVGVLYAGGRPRVEDAQESFPWNVELDFTFAVWKSNTSRVSFLQFAETQ